MKSKLISTTLVATGFILGATALSALAGTWAAPGAGCTPPNCNTEAPINASTTEQTKLGPLTLNFSNLFTVGLKVLGNIQIVDGNQGAGKVLTSDASGIATWATPQSGGGATIGSGVRCPMDGQFSDAGGSAGYGFDLEIKCIGGYVKYLSNIGGQTFPQTTVPQYKIKYVGGNKQFYGNAAPNVVTFTTDSSDYITQMCDVSKGLACTGGTSDDIACNWGGELNVAQTSTFVTCINNKVYSIGIGGYRMPAVYSGSGALYSLAPLTAPSALIYQNPAGISSNQATRARTYYFSWDPSTGPSASISYHVNMHFVESGGSPSWDTTTDTTTNNFTYVFSNASMPGLQVTVTVTAYDSVGNTSGPSNSVTFTRDTL